MVYTQMDIDLTACIELGIMELCVSELCEICDLFIQFYYCMFISFYFPTSIFTMTHTRINGSFISIVLYLSGFYFRGFIF